MDFWFCFVLFFFTFPKICFFPQHDIMDSVSVCVYVGGAQPEVCGPAEGQSEHHVFFMECLSYSRVLILKTTNRFLQRNLAQNESRKKFQNQQRGEVTADSCRVLLWPGTVGRCGHGT